MGINLIKPDFMTEGIRKSRLTQAIYNMKDEAMLKAIEAMVDHYESLQPKVEFDHRELLGTLTDEEAEEMHRIVKEMRKCDCDDCRLDNGRY
jgi:hypothetical protein